MEGGEAPGKSSNALEETPKRCSIFKRQGTSKMTCH